MADILKQPVIAVFLIVSIGYIIGNIKVCGIELGSAGVLFTALTFGHFGWSVPSVISDIGLACFVTAVGLIAGPKFFLNFMANIKSYVLIAVVVILAGVLCCIAVIKTGGIPTDLAVGLMTGALTSSPGLAAALEATHSHVASVGYGIAYPFGVLGVVLFVQLVPNLMRRDMAHEKEIYCSKIMDSRVKKEKHLICIDATGIFPFALAVVLGMIFAQIKIPLGNGAQFSLGTSGGPLLAGLIIGHFGNVGNVDLKVRTEALEALKEFGMVIFLAGAGTQAGGGFVEILKEQGAMLFVYGAVMTVVPMMVGFVVSFMFLRLCLFDSLGAICGGMTSTPALGTLIRKAETSDVAMAYAATYPVALVLVVICSQWIGMVF